jgi:hypothetical protein
MNNRKGKIILWLFFLCACSANAQTFEWWRDNVQWDGTTHWWKYMTVSPKFFGPNALSVPSMNNGSADSTASLGVSGAFHFMKGDRTQNLVLYGNYTTPGNSISIDAQFIPHERFRLSHDLKTERKVYYQDYYRKSTTGDVVVNTVFQVFRKWRPRVQLAMRVGVRMPSGGGLGAARYADVPGYWIDAGAGIPIGKSNWKWNHMMGFLVWQTNEDHLRQNDAFLFGTGAEFNKNGLKMQLHGAGYIGYKDNGDKPIVFRANIEKVKSRCAYFLRLQQGLNDFEYFSVETGGRLLFK